MLALPNVKSSLEDRIWKLAKWNVRGENGKKGAELGNKIDLHNLETLGIQQK